MTEVLDWLRAADPRELARRAAQALAAGELVALPTETVYGLAASALIPAAVERLTHGKGRPEGKPLALAIRGSHELADWVPSLSRLGDRLARRCWPGPVTLVFAGVESGRLGQLPEAVRQRVSPAGTIGLRVPAHEAALEVLYHLAGPLVLTSANRSGEPPATTAEQVVDAVGEDLAVVIDAGPSHFAKASTVVRVDGEKWEILREGVLSRPDIEQATGRLIVFVCTGNTCRSPLAEGICKQLLAERLGCRPEELPARGFHVLSAGLAAMMGGAAAAEAVQAASELGVDLKDHSSQPLTEPLVHQADVIVAMTQSHVLTLASRFPEAEARVRLLAASGDDLPDPIGGDLEVYRTCAAGIRHHLEHLLPELLA